MDAIREDKFTEALRDLIEDSLDNYVGDCVRVLRVDSFSESGLLTSNEGLVITLSNGAEFQLTIVQSKEGEPDCEDDTCDDDV